MKGILGLLQYPVERMKGFFDDMCDNISLESAVKQLEADCSFAKRHPWEIDLVTLSEEQLRDLAQSNPITQKVQFLSELPSRLASFEKLAHDGDVRARQASNALRAHGKLMQMQNAFKSKFSQQVHGEPEHAAHHQQHTPQHTPTAGHTCTDKDDIARLKVLQQSSLQLPDRSQPPQAASFSAAAHFRGGQQVQSQAAPLRGSNSKRQQEALAQRQMSQQTATGRGQLDSTIRLAQGKPGDPSVADYAKSGGHRQQQVQQRLSVQSQQVQKQMQANQLSQFSHTPVRQGLGGQQVPQGLLRPASSGRTQLPLQPSQASTQGARQGRSASHVEFMECPSCNIKRNCVLMVEVPGSSFLICRGCYAKQTNPQAAPLDRKKVPPRSNPGAPGRAAVRRQQQSKKGNSDEAPIELVDDSDDEEPPQQQQHDSTTPEPQDQQQERQQSAGPAAAGTRHTRHSSPVVDLLGGSHLGTALKYQGLQALYPPSGGKGAVSVTADDLERLDPDAFLNDTIIDYYIKRLELSLPAEVLSRFHFFNSFFFKKLTEKSSTTPGASRRAEDVGKRNHDRVKSWTKGIDIFSKDYLFVPVHDALHWSLVIICHPALLQKAAAAQGWSLHPEALAEPAAAAGGDSDGSQGDKAAVARTAGASDAAGRIVPAPCILHLDSMTSGHTTGGIGTALRQYLEHEWMRKVNEQRQQQGNQQEQAATDPKQQQVPLLKFDTKVLPTQRICDKLPKQDNHCDCGLFVLTYLEFFVHSAPRALNNHLLKNLQTTPVELCPMQPKLLRKDWFEPSLASCLRGHLRHQLLKLMIEQATEKQSAQVAQAVADVNQYEEGIALQRKRLQEQQEPGEVNPLFAYMSPAEYQRSDIQQLLQSYKKRQEELKRSRRNKRSQSGVTNAELAREEYIRSLAADGGDPGDDSDWEPESDKNKGPKVKTRKGNHVVFSDSDDDDDDAQPQAKQPRKTPPAVQRVYGPQLPDTAAAAASKDVEHCTVSGSDNEDDAFQDRQPSKRARSAAASAGKTQQKHVMMQPESQQVQELWQQKQDDKDSDGDAMQVDEPAQQQRQHKGQRAGSKRQQEHLSDQPAPQRMRGLPPPDDAGGSAIVTQCSSESNSSYNRSISDGSPGGFQGHRPMGFDIAAAVGGEQEESSGGDRRQQQQQQHARGRMPRIEQAEQQGMSITPPSVRKTAAPAEAAEASSGSPSDQVADNGDSVGVPVAGHDLVDLCGNDDSEDVQDEQQPQSQELPQQPSPWRQNFSDTQQDQQQDKEGSPEADHAVPDLQQTTGAVGLEPQQEQQQQQQQQRDEALRDEAYSIVIELHTEDPSSLDYLTRTLPHQFPNCSQNHEQLDHSTRKRILQFINNAGLDGRITQALLPQFLAALDSYNSALESDKQRWIKLLPGYHSEQQPQVASKGKGRARVSSAGQRKSRAATAATASAIDHKQQKLTEMKLTVDFAPGVNPSPELLKRTTASLRARVREVLEDGEQEEEQQQQQKPEQQLQQLQHSDGQDDLSEEHPELDLRLNGKDDSAKEVFDLASDSDVELVDGEQQQRHCPPRLSPVLLNPWGTAGDRQRMAAGTAVKHQEMQQDQGLQHFKDLRRQIQANVFDEVDGKAAPGAAARCVAGEVGVGSGSTDSSYETANGGQDVDVNAVQPVHLQHSVSAAPHAAGRRAQQQQQRAVTQRMAVGIFAKALQTESDYILRPLSSLQQQQPPQLPADVRPNYGSGLSSHNAESVATDEHEQHAAAAAAGDGPAGVAAEVTSPPPPGQPQQTELQPLKQPAAAAATAAAAAKLSKGHLKPGLCSVQLAARMQPQHQPAVPQGRRTRSAGACRASVNVQSNSSSVECID